MKVLAGISFFILLLHAFPQTLQAQKKERTEQFIFFSQDREKIHNESFCSNKGIDGAQITYTWKTLEPEKDKYDFSEINEDLRFLSGKGKKLFVQIQDVTFYPQYSAVPQYLLTDTMYHGGRAQQCVVVHGKRELGGWFARRWDPAVAERYHMLLQKLAEQFDGRIEGMNLSETSIDICDDFLPKDFTNDLYLKAIKENMKVARECFKKSIPLLYANFMPGDGMYLQSLYNYAKEIKMGMGVPDILVYRKYQMLNSYPMIRDISNIVPTGGAVQEGNYAVINEKTKKRVTVPEILSFAEEYLKLNYIFWCTEEPYYSQKVLPMLKALKK